MISRMRFYMTFAEEWCKYRENPADALREALEVGLDVYGEGFISFEYHEGVGILNMMTDRDAELIGDLIVESLAKIPPGLTESDVDIEIDLDVEVLDFDDF